MDILRLNPSDSSYLPDMVFDQYSSFVWTERFGVFGDFELRSPNIDHYYNNLPLGTLISHRKTEAVSIVETISIQENEDNSEEIVLTGRTAESVFTQRHVEAPYGKKRLMAKTYSTTGAAGVLMWNAVDNHTTRDVSRTNIEINSTDDPPRMPEGGYQISALDRVPNVLITDSVFDDGENKNWWLSEGPLWPQLEKIMGKSDISIRTIRPNKTSGTKFAVGATPGTHGDVIRSFVENITELRFDMYQGLDRSLSQSDNPRVVFNTKRRDVFRPAYLFSEANYKTACEIMSSKGGADVYRNSVERAYSGWDRRVTSVDSGSPEEPDRPEDPGKNATKQQNDRYEERLASWKNRIANIRERFLEDAKDDALKELKKTRPVSLFTGDISPSAPYRYKTHYNLGDVVTLQGEYGERTKMLVSEYVYAHDREGYREYPGLSLV